ncbi:MAG: oxygenase MpaB family protein [Acidimicrobiales bacterium]
MSDPFAGLRSAIAGAVRDRVAGPGADRRAAEVWAAPGPRWFGPDRPVHTVHGDPAMFLGGLRALLLQSLHPLAMAGVAQHSAYREDPWGRLQRTADFLAATTFGPADEAERACQRVIAVHRHVRGVARDGRPYAAGDPHLLAWVHVTEVDSFLAAHQRYGSRRLTPAEADGYVADLAVVARRLGVVDPPVDVAGLRRTLGAYRSELRSTPEARAAARFLLLPPLPAVARPPYAIGFAAAVGLLPWWARLALGLPPLTPVTDTLVRPAAGALVDLLRWALSEHGPGATAAASAATPAPTR